MATELVQKLPVAALAGLVASLSAVNPAAAADFAPAPNTSNTIVAEQNQAASSFTFQVIIGFTSIAKNAVVRLRVLYDLLLLLRLFPCAPAAIQFPCAPAAMQPAQPAGQTVTYIDTLLDGVHANMCNTRWLPYSASCFVTLTSMLELLFAGRDHQRPGCA